MKRSVIAIVHNEPRINDNAYSDSSADVMQQVETVESSLRQLEYDPIRIPFTKNLYAFLSRLDKEDISMIFNLCETVDEEARFAGHPAAVFELLGLPFSGSPSIAIMNTTDKIMTKRVLRAAGIRTPNYLIYEGSEFFPQEALSYPVIVKPRYEDASIGIDQDSVCPNETILKDMIHHRFERFGPLFVEEFISGREFNVSLIGYPYPKTLPIAEIDYSGFSKDLYPMVGYRAKWDSHSSEYRFTPRIFPEDLCPRLKDNLERTAVKCFKLMGLRDYGRVDFRIDSKGRIFVLEVNANPCLSLDAGFPAASERDGIDYTRMISLIVSFMEKRKKHD